MEGKKEGRWVGGRWYDISSAFLADGTWKEVLLSEEVRYSKDIITLYVNWYSFYSINCSPSHL